MIHTPAPLRDVWMWIRGSGLEILLLVLDAVLLTRFATWLRALVTERIDANDRESDALVRSEAAKHRHALAQVLTWSALFIVYCATAVQILERLRAPITGLVAPAAVVGVALGFGGQRLVQDLLAGFFIIAERQYGFGDLISIAIPGIPGGVIGTVEDVTLRVTKVRTPMARSSSPRTARSSSSPTCHVTGPESWSMYPSPSASISSTPARSCARWVARSLRRRRSPPPAP